MWQCVPVWEGCNSLGRMQLFGKAVHVVTMPAATYIFVRKTLQVRPRDQKRAGVFRLAGQDLRFSMKMMFAPAY